MYPFGASGFMVENEEFRVEMQILAKFCHNKFPIYMVFSALQ
jgi:hypothetical protein